LLGEETAQWKGSERTKARFTWKGPVFPKEIGRKGRNDQEEIMEGHSQKRKTAKGEV
jgi:hypothetical protein